MKKKSILLTTLALCVMLLVGACGTATDAVNTVSNTVAQILNGNVKGEIGKTYSTQWFEFTVKSIEKMDSYAGYEPENGFELYAVLLSEKSTFSKEIPMGTFDFYMDEDSFEEYIFPMDPLDNTMMPLEFKLNKGDAVEYYMIYEIPAGTEGLMLCYTEINENEDEGVLFTIAIN